jgi:two-component system sensor histidine kinase/response regulator
MVENNNKILIIDDEDVVLDSCTQILEGGNYQITTARNGAIGLNLVEEFQPDIVYVDLKMPGISGFEVLEKINEIDPTIISIVITGYATVSSAVEAMKKGADDFLPKPFTPDELRLITQRGIDKRKLVLETIALRREKEMLKDHFAAIVSHELKSPLGAVQQNLYILIDELSDKLSEDQLSRFEHIRSRIDDLMKLIHTWLRVISSDDIRNIREGFSPVSLQDIITKAIDNVQTHATRKDIEIIPSIDTDLALIEGDEGTLVEALVNIIGNAIKFSRVNSQILVDAKEEAGNVLVSITDTGVGIPKEEIPLIFQDFYQGKSGHVAEGGSGLGLALTRRIIEAHNGSITVESELGKGSTFTIQLPIMKSDQPSHLNVETDVLAHP